MPSRSAAGFRSSFEMSLASLIEMVNNPGHLRVRCVGPRALRDRNIAPCSHRYGCLRMVTIMPQGFPSVNIELRTQARLELDEEDAAELIDLLIATIQADRFQRSSRIERLHGILAQLLLVAGDSL